MSSGRCWYGRHESCETYHEREDLKERQSDDRFDFHMF